VTLGVTGSSPELLIELGLILLALSVLARLANRMRLSPIPFYLVVGLAAGRGGLVDVEGADEFIEAGSQLGVVLLLFFLGIEYSARELVTSLRASTRSGVLDLVLNFPPGFAAGLLLGWDFEEAFLLGGVTYISSSGIAAKLLHDLGRMGNRETPSVISVLVFEDLIMTVYLPIVAALLLGGSGMFIVSTVAIALTVVTGVLVIAWHLGPSLSALVFHQSAEAMMFGVLGATLLVAGLAEEAQVSAAVGAFLVGIALSGPAAEAAHDLLEPLRDLFAAAFFVFFALETEAGAIVDVLALAAALAAVSIVTKLVTGWYAAARHGVAIRGRLRAGTMLVARGEFSIVIAGLAVGSGNAGEIVEVAAAYVLLLAVVGPVMARYAEVFARPFERRAGRRFAATAAAPTTEQSGG
jgi:monovalent cation:H+ antiporter-2, CPA2 family